MQQMPESLGAGGGCSDEAGGQLAAARLWRQVVVEVLESLPLGAKPWRILEAAGGPAWPGIELAARGHRLTFSEAAEGMRQALQQEVGRRDLAGQVELVGDGLCDLRSLADDRFDLVLAPAGGLSYVQDARRGLEELYRVTRPGGMLFAEVENRFSGARAARRGRGWDEMSARLQTGWAPLPGEPDQKLRTFAPAELRLLLQDVGWRVIYVWGANVLQALLGADALEAAARRQDQWAELVQLERRLRNCRDLTGAGLDVQVLACK
jgi:SAM-dependent methyltransferase